MISFIITIVVPVSIAASIVATTPAPASSPATEVGIESVARVIGRHHRIVGIGEVWARSVRIHCVHPVPVAHLRIVHRRRKLLLLLGIHTGRPIEIGVCNNKSRHYYKSSHTTIDYLTLLIIGHFGGPLRRL